MLYPVTVSLSGRCKRKYSQNPTTAFVFNLCGWLSLLPRSRKVPGFIMAKKSPENVWELSMCWFVSLTSQQRLKNLWSCVSSFTGNLSVITLNCKINKRDRFALYIPQWWSFVPVGLFSLILLLSYIIPLCQTEGEIKWVTNLVVISEPAVTVLSCQCMDQREFSNVVF